MNCSCIVHNPTEAWLSRQTGEENNGTANERKTARQIKQGCGSFFVLYDKWMIGCEEEGTGMLIQALFMGCS